MYADDMILIRKSKKEIQIQLNACEEYANKNGLKFNPDKSVFMIFNSYIERSKNGSKRDAWQGELLLDGSNVHMLFLLVNLD